MSLVIRVGACRRVANRATLASRTAILARHSYPVKSSKIRPELAAQDVGNLFLSTASLIRSTQDLIKSTSSQLTGNKSVDSPEREALLLLACALGLSPDKLATSVHVPITPEQEHLLASLIERRQIEEPLAYIRGSKEFWSLVFKVTRDCLIPRPATEVLVEQSLQSLKAVQNPSILDIGTGTGCIVISIVKSLGRDATAFATDMDEKTLKIASENAITHGVDSRIKFLRTNWAEALLVGQQRAAEFDLVVSNPPYLTPDELESVDATVSKFEPARALIGGRDGISAYRAIASQALRLLKPDGTLIVEIGNRQRASVTEIFQASGFSKVMCVEDSEGHDRCLVIKRR